MSKITGEILIDRPVEVVFDFVVDERNEALYKPGSAALGQGHRRGYRRGYTFSRHPQVASSTR